MTIGSSIVLIAIGAVLKWAVTAHVSGFNIQTAGTVLLIVGIVGLILAIWYTFYWTRQRPATAETRVYRDVRDPVDRY
jgi:Zn-dependent protease with chaperone function